MTPALKKIAGRFTAAEEERRGRRFALAGATAFPVSSAIGNLIEKGKVIPAGVKPARWLGSRVAAGTLVAGALPLIRRKITEGVEADASERRRRQAIAEGMREYWATKKTAAKETRGKRRLMAGLEGAAWSLPTALGGTAVAGLRTGSPIAAILTGASLLASGAAGAVAGSAAAGHLMKKRAAINSNFKATSRDNRTPFVGQTQYPTEGSKGHASSLLSKSQGKTEKGPMPSFGALDKSGISPLQSQTVTQLTSAGSIPKIGADMSNLVNDPLIQYFASQPGQEEFRKYAEALKDNLGDLPKGKEEKERQSENPDPSKNLADTSAEQTDAALKSFFDNYPTEKAVIS